MGVVCRADTLGVVMTESSNQGVCTLEEHVEQDSLVGACYQLTYMERTELTASFVLASRLCVVLGLVECGRQARQE